MRPNALRARLTRGEVAVNAWTSLDSPYAAEILSHCGFDAVTVDLQHGMFGLDTAIRLLQAVSTGPAVPLVRCSTNAADEIGKLLDAGAYGVICPSVDGAAECAAFVAACRYPPLGTRSYGPSRGLLYGGPDYVEHADDTILTWAMIESVVALADLDAILATEGLDGVYIGPNDLALALGLAPVTGALPPQLARVVADVLASVHRAGRWAGIFCNSAEQAAELADQGFDLVTPGNDAGLLREAATERIDRVRRTRTTVTSSY